MVASREKFSSQAAPELLESMRQIARKEGRFFQAVLEDAMRQYLENKQLESPNPEFMAHLGASMERNRRLLDLLAQ